MTNPQTISRFYLTLVSFLAAVIALGLGHSKPLLYVPIWLAHSALMASAVWYLGKKCFTNPNPAFPFIMPYLIALNLINLANRVPDVDL